ncbi:hypothetical protein NE848_15230 [Gramella jeungdoensis]|uniref:AraC family transcriptional regulator n=1 Tax=Gramella jeungdoensis TaxID=708091 RepID=A0ABT0Z6G0_9FLAO|nr:hypothetical protein [Gramella jeungdoensis]MCM8570747.1 hypothetical protein [Gramella jeungdoensis]
MKKAIVIILVLFLAGLSWYLFIKKYDYQFHMEARYGPGTVFNEVSDWKNFTHKSVKEDITIIDKDSFSSLTQAVDHGGHSPLEFYWEFEKENDSITQVVLNIRSSENKLINRLAIVNPFQKSIYLDTLKERILDFKKRLNEKQNTYSIKIEDKVVKSPGMDCICHSSQNIPVKDKAKEMVNTITILEDYVLQRELRLTANPFVKVTKWNRKTDVIDFDFCFPVNLAQDIQPTSNVDFKQVKPFPALRAIFHGNYRNSHLAWYDLVEESKELNKVSNELPLEIFFNNPKVEANSARDWKAEIYLPVLE